MSKAPGSVRCGSEGYLRLSQTVSVLPLISLSAGWFVSIINFHLQHFRTSRPPVAQLKVNLRPLWAPTMKALSELSTRCDPVLWSAVFEDLRRLSEGLALELSPEWVKESFSDDGDDIQEVERTWQDPSAHKMRVAISTWTSDRVSRRRIVKVCHHWVESVPFVEILQDASLQ